MALNWQTIAGLLNSGLPLLNPSANAQTGGISLGLPRGLEQLGGAAGLLYGLVDQPTVEVPNYQDFASPAGAASTSYLRGLFEAPADPFAAGGVYSRYLPFLQQQENDLLDNVQQRFAAGLPSSLTPTMGGQELGALRSSISNELLPRRQALFADLTRENQQRQLQAATSLGGMERLGQYAGFEANLTAAQQAAEAERNRNAQLAQLGLALLLGGNSSAASSPFAAPGGTATSGVGHSLGQALTQALSQQVGANFGMPQQLGQLTPAALQAALQQTGGLAFRTAAGQVVPISLQEAQALAAQGYGGQIVSQAGTPIAAAGADAGIAGAGLLGPSGVTSAMGLLSALGAGASGYGAGSIAASLGQNQAQSTLGGAAGGAAVGFAVGGPVGAAIGAITGGLTGFFKERSSQHEQKEAFRRSDIDSQADQVQEIGAFFSHRLKALGVDTSAFDQTVSQLITASPGPGHEQEDIARIGGQALLSAIQKIDPTITSLGQVPGLRDQFIDYLTRTTYTAGNSSYGGGPALNFIQGGWAQAAGLRHGGILPRGGVAVVGEAGPELLIAGPGTSVIPLLSNDN